MGLPLPTGTLYQINRRYWPGEDDYTGLTDAEVMEKKWDAYQGRFKKWFRRTDPMDADHNVTSNRCEPIVSTGVDFLLGDEVGFEVTKDDGSKDEEAQAYLDAFWDANNKMPTLAEYEINSAIFGHAFFKLIPDDPDMLPYISEGKRMDVPSLAVLSPQQMCVDTQPADVRKAKRYVFCYTDEDDNGDTIQCRQVTERQKDNTWLITDQYRKSTSPGRMSVNDVMSFPTDPEAGWIDMDAPVVWQYSWPPIHDSKNLPEPNSHWGKADLRMDIIHLNDVLNFLLSDAKAIIYAQGQPKDVFFGIRAKDLDVRANGAICIPSTQARVEHIEMTGDLAAIQMFIDRIRRQMDELSHVPAVAVGDQEKLQPASGVALKVAYRPLINQTMMKRNLREAVYTKLCQHVLELGNYGEARKVTINWAEMVPTDELEDSKTAVSDLSIGASNYTLLKKRGFDPDVEREKKREEQEEEQTLASNLMAQFDAGIGPDGAMPPGAMPPGQQPPGQPGAPGQSPSAQAGNLNHPAMQAARQAAMANAGGN